MWTEGGLTQVAKQNSSIHISPASKQNFCKTTKYQILNMLETYLKFKILKLGLLIGGRGIIAKFFQGFMNDQNIIDYEISRKDKRKVQDFMFSIPGRTSSYSLQEARRNWKSAYCLHSSFLNSRPNCCDFATNTTQYQRTTNYFFRPWSSNSNQCL